MSYRRHPPERLRRLAQQIYDLGPRPTYELLAELEAGADPYERIERYARLHPLGSFIAAHGGDRLPTVRPAA